MTPSLSRLLTVLCVTLAAQSLLANDPAPESEGTARRARLLAVLIGGMDSDPTPAQIAGTGARQDGNSGLYRLRQDLDDERIVAEYFNWNGSRAGELKRPDPPRSPAIAAFIREYVQEHPRDRVALVGNSWGGHTALEVSRLLYDHETPVAVSLAVFLDASSAGRVKGNPERLPDNLNRAVHYYTRNVFVWGPLPARARIDNIDLGNPENGYMRRRVPPYDAPFDFRAHVAAEWDERIHADICRRLLEVAPAE